jgi:lipoprotein signal peptidase
MGSTTLSAALESHCRAGWPRPDDEQGSCLRTVRWSAVLGVAVCVAAIAASHRGERGLASGLLLVFAGFVGNFIDRLVAGQVTDFLWVRGWSVFNFADCLVTAGAIMCGLALLFPNRWSLHG